MRLQLEINGASPEEKAKPTESRHQGDVSPAWKWPAWSAPSVVPASKTWNTSLARDSRLFPVFFG